MSFASTNIGRATIIAHTALGYAALWVHFGLFAPGLSIDPSAARYALAFANLAGAGWCFLRAFCGALRLGPAPAAPPGGAK